MQCTHGVMVHVVRMCTHGVRMVYAVRIYGVRMVYAEHILGVCMVHQVHLPPCASTGSTSGHGPRLAEPPSKVGAGELRENHCHAVRAQRQRAGRVPRLCTTHGPPSVELVDCSVLERGMHARPLRHEAGAAQAREGLGAPGAVEQTHNG